MGVDTAMAPARKTTAEPPAMGLRGWWRDLANLSAVALVCLMFYQSQSNLWSLMREDRNATLHALQTLQDGQAETTKAIRSLARELHKAKGDE